MGNGVRTHVNSKGNIPSTVRWMEPTTLHQAGQRAQHTTNELFRSPSVIRSGKHPKKQLQDGVATTPRHWDRRGQHPPAGQNSTSHNLYTENWTLSTPLPPPQTENWTLSTPLPPPQTEHFPFRQMSMRHRSSNPQPHPTVLPHLGRFETPDMVQSGGCPQEALGTG